MEHYLSDHVLNFRQRLEGLAARVPGVQLRFTAKDVEPFAVWPGFRGQPNQIMPGLMAPGYLAREVLCGGPAPCMQAVRQMLQSLGHDRARQHEESFAAPQAQDVPIDLAPAATAAEVPFARAGRAVATDGTETVLAVARKARLNIPFSGNFGLCGTCKVKRPRARWRWSTTAASPMTRSRPASAWPAGCVRRPRSSAMDPTPVRQPRPRAMHQAGRSAGAGPQVTPAPGPPAAQTSTSTLNSGREKPATSSSVDAGRTPVPARKASRAAM